MWREPSAERNMGTSKRSLKKNKTEPSPPAQTNGDGAEPPRCAPPVDAPQPRTQFSADGMIEEGSASSWARLLGRKKEDSRTLAELVASVMSAQELEAPEAAEAPNGAAPEPHVLAEAAHGTEVIPAKHAPDTVPGEVTGEDAWRNLKRRGAGAASLVLAVLAVLGVVWLSTIAGTSPTGAPEQEQIVAAPPDGGPPSDGSLPPSSGEAPPQAAPVAAPAPTPEPAPAQEPAPAPGAPAPTAAPAPAPVPPPPPPPPLLVHIADLDGGPKGGKVFVQIWVHDASHAPVEGATVSVVWEGGSGQSSCVTGPGGSCSVHTTNLSSPGTVTLTVAGVSVPGGSYDAGSNHDPDGDSNGTAITVGL